MGWIHSRIGDGVKLSTKLRMASRKTLTSEPPTFTDIFDRPDGPLAAPWVQAAESGTADFGVASGKGVTTRTAGTDLAVAAIVDLGAPVGVVEWDLSAWPKGPVYSIFRFVDINNFWLVGGTISDGSLVYLFTLEAGAWTVKGVQSGVTWGAGRRLTVTDDGLVVAVKVDGVSLPGLSASSSTFADATKAGIGGNAKHGDLTDARWSRFHMELR